MAEEAGVDGERVRDLKRALNLGYDGYVHGAYSTAMELYHGGRHAFMLQGDESARARCIQRVAVAGKLHEVLCAVSLVAESRGETRLWDEVLASVKELDDSLECSTAAC